MTQVPRPVQTPSGGPVVATPPVSPSAATLDWSDSPLPRRTTRPVHNRAPNHTAQAPTGTRYFVGYIAELDDDSDGEQLMEFSGTAFLDEAEAREELEDAQGWRPGWHLYHLTDITDRTNP